MIVPEYAGISYIQDMLIPQCKPHAGESKRCTSQRVPSPKLTLNLKWAPVKRIVAHIRPIVVPNMSPLQETLLYLDN